jgi:molybdopterin converting factor small subunit
VPVDWYDGINGLAILENIGIPADDVAIYLINGKNANLDDALSRDDVVSFFPPVGGG